MKAKTRTDKQSLRALARTGGVQAERALKHTHPNTPSKNGSAPRNGGVLAERAHKQTHPNTPGWIGGLQKKAKPQQTHNKLEH